MRFWSHSAERYIVAWCATRYTVSVIKSFKHKGLRGYYETGSKSGIQAKHAGRLRLQLAALDTARVVADMDVPDAVGNLLQGFDGVFVGAMDMAGVHVEPERR